MRSREATRATLGWRQPRQEEIMEDRKSLVHPQLSLPSVRNTFSSGGESSSPRGRPRTHRQHSLRDKLRPVYTQARSKSPKTKGVSRKDLRKNEKYGYNDTRLNCLSRE